MLKKVIVVGGLVLSVSLAGVAFAGNGAETMVLKGGSPGDVSFPHKVHQDKLKDCKLCHKLFGEEADAIQKGIAAKTLKKKDAMKECMDCHKATKAKGEKSGPTGCKECHKK